MLFSPLPPAPHQKPASLSEKQQTKHFCKKKKSDYYLELQNEDKILQQIMDVRGV